MEEFQLARTKAQEKLKLADHMLTQTYPLVKDPKLLVAVMENLFLALTNAMGSVLYYERTFKKIPPFVDNFENKFEMFKQKCTPKYKLSRDYVSLISEIKEAVLAHRTSPVEFAREGNFVICSDNYKLKTLSVDQIKKYAEKTKTFLKETNAIVMKNEGIFR
ncbi:hypothetical protein JW707_00065 [Candidatus Woesearchaeota archaeon]|nr:hypothetical protein [Candidatus Woesearchaeota archaeon]